MFVALNTGFSYRDMEQSRLPNQANRMLVNFDENGGKVLGDGGTISLCKTGFYFV